MMNNDYKSDFEVFRLAVKAVYSGCINIDPDTDTEEMDMLYQIAATIAVDGDITMKQIMRIKNDE